VRNSKKQNHLIIILTAALWLSACSDSGESKEPQKNSSIVKPIQIMGDDVEISASASETSDRRIVVGGSTNLPIGTEFLISLENEVIGFQAQDKASVEHGKFSSAPMGPKSGLADAKYLIEVLMPLPFTQPEQVQQIIGVKGEHLTGRLVEESEFGGKVVTFTTSYSLGSEAEIEQSAKSHNELVGLIANEAARLIEEGRKMDRLRVTNDLALISECGEKMRKHQNNANALRNKTDTLSNRYIRLGAAVIELNMCVSCSRTAMEACDRAATYLAKQNEI
jgi:hypothetical protein